MTSAQWEGASWKVLSCLCFAIANGFIKWLSLRLPSESIAFFQNFFGFVFLLPFLLRAPRISWRTQRPALQIWRVLASCIGILLWYKAISLMPIGQAVALNFTGPLITILGAYLFLGEQLTAIRFFSILLGFLGSILIVNARYLTGEIPWGSQGWIVLLPLGSAAAFSICTLLNKKLTSYDSPITIVTYLMGFMIPFLGIVSWTHWVWPSATDLLLLSFLGGIGALAHFALTRSFTCSDITFLLPFGSTRLIASALIGLFFFGQTINFFVFMGSTIILGGLFILSYWDKEKEGSRWGGIPRLFSKSTP
jgi:drug/metabolite transporter (DMT)-like permease